MSVHEMKPSFRERDPVFYLLLGLLSSTRAFTSALGPLTEDPARRWVHRAGIRRGYDQLLMASLGLVSLGRSIQRLFDEGQEIDVAAPDVARDDEAPGLGDVLR